MNCSESHNLLQQRLDGAPVPDQVALDRHLAECAECRSLHAAAGRLEEGLSLLPSPAQPDGLNDRIVRALLAERRAARRFRRRVLVATSLAAGLLVVALGLYLRPRSDESPGVLDRIQGYVSAIFGPRMTLPASSHGPPPAPLPGWVDRELDEMQRNATPPSLQASVSEAGSAVVSLTRRTADETVGQGRMLLPDMVPVPDDASPEVVRQTIDPAAQSLREARQGAAVSFEPVTTSARRAVGLFLREVPGADADPKPGL
jgi:hypothetical protein